MGVFTQDFLKFRGAGIRSGPCAATQSISSEVGNWTPDVVRNASVRENVCASQSHHVRPSRIGSRRRMAGMSLKLTKDAATHVTENTEPMKRAA